MNFLSVSSGIDVASCAWTPLGFECIGFSEIDPQAIAVLKKRWPQTPHLGNMENFREWSLPAFNILVGGTPCQSFSVAGLRAGLDDPRGNLALVYLAIAERFRPEWLVWENVPGSFSALTHDAPDPLPPEEPLGMGCDGRTMETFDEYDAEERHAFGCFVAGLQELGYGFAYRVLDAQYFGVPQRRRRIFLVANSRGWGRAAAVLFERESLRRHPPPSRETREETTAPSGVGAAGSSESGTVEPGDAYVPDISPAVTAKWAKRSGGPAGDEAQNLIAKSLRASDGGVDREDMHTLIADQVADPITAQEGRMTSHGGNNPRPHNLVVAPDQASTLTAGGHPNSNSPGRHQEDDDNIVACFDETQVTHPENRSNCKPETAGLASHARPPAIAFKPSHYTRDKDAGPSEIYPPLMADADKGDQDPVVAVSLRGRDGGNLPEIEPGNVSPALRTGGGGSGNPMVLKTAVRRLTPRECERLMGLPDDYTLVNYKGKPLSDTARYRLIGNGIVRECLEFVGQRIKLLVELVP